MWEIIKRCVSVLTVRERRSLIPLVLMMVFGGLIESVSVGLVIPLIAGIIDSGQLTEGTVGSILRAVFGERDGSSYLALLLVVMAMVFIGKNAFLLWRTYQQNKVAATVRQRVQKRLLHYYLTRPYSFYLDVESGDVLRTLNNDSDQFYQLFSNVLGFFSSLVITVIIFVRTTKKNQEIHAKAEAERAAALAIEEAEKAKAEDEKLRGIIREVINEVLVENKLIQKKQ